MKPFRILAIDADSQKGFPNLALMKQSTYYKKTKNAEIELRLGIPDSLPLGDYDLAIISCIYSQNRAKVWNYSEQLPFPVIIGGSGFDLKKTLSEEIEHIRPDYELYDIDFSLGFTSRGCIRSCGFCIVNEKEGSICDHAPIKEFLGDGHKKVVLLDNNFLASPKWGENMEYAIDNKLKINFNQGLDIRLVNEEFAQLLSECKYQTWKFNSKRVSFAYDSVRYKTEVEKGIQILKDAGIKGYTLMFYILVGYDSSIYEDLDRIDQLIEWGVDPYIMRYNQTVGPHRVLMHLARWVNWRIYKSCSFFDYDYSDSQESIKKAFEVPHSSWGGYYCSHGAYAWTHRDMILKEDDITEIQRELSEFDIEE